jgi:hypothetical protein
MWSALAVTTCFTLLLCVWWSLTHPSDRQVTDSKATGPVGIAAITVVFMSMLFFMRFVT